MHSIRPKINYTHLKAQSIFNRTFKHRIPITIDKDTKTYFTITLDFQARAKKKNIQAINRTPRIEKESTAGPRLCRIIGNKSLLSSSWNVDSHLDFSIKNYDNWFTNKDMNSSINSSACVPVRILGSPLPP